MIAKGEHCMAFVGPVIVGAVYRFKQGTYSAIIDNYVGYFSQWSDPTTKPPHFTAERKAKLYVIQRFPPRVRKSIRWRSFDDVIRQVRVRNLLQFQ